MLLIGTMVARMLVVESVNRIIIRSVNEMLKRFPRK